MSALNGAASRRMTLQLAVMTIGAGLAAAQASTAAASAVLIAPVLAPISTYHSLTLDALALPHRGAEVSALLGNANVVGAIVAGLALTGLSPSRSAVAGRRRRDGACRIEGRCDCQPQA